MSEIEILNKKIDNLEKKLDLLLGLSNRSYNLKDFCGELGISQYKLKSLYRARQLAIPAPFRMNGKDAVYTNKDLIYMKGIINGKV